MKFAAQVRYGKTNPTFNAPLFCFTRSVLQGRCILSSIKAAALGCFDSISKQTSKIITDVRLEREEGNKES